MMYVSFSEPGVRRGAHLHKFQQDYFIFIGSGNFRVVVVDNRPESSTYKNCADFYVGENNPAAVIIPTDCWHGYQNVSSKMGMVINIPDKLYKGKNYSEPVDEVRCKWEEIYAWPEIVD
jgi:dTDP-4-dehydrorhamnose 3,5-epimerase-like enzyme